MGLLKIAVRNAYRNKLRTLLTLGAVTTSVVFFIVMRTVIWSWTASAQQGAQDRIGTRHKVSFVLQIPRRYADEIRQVPGVRQVAHASWFGAKDPNHTDDLFSSVAVEPEEFLALYDEIELHPEHVEAWKQDRQGVIVGDVLAKKRGWQVGQRITLQGTLYPGDWQFNISGIYTTRSSAIDRSTVWLQYEYLDESRPPRLQDQVGWIMSRVADPGRAADVARAVDERFASRGIQTLSMSERALQASFLGMVSAVLRLIDAVSVVTMLIMTLILGNTIAMGLRERTHEYGALRAMGFLPKHIVLFVLSEGLVLGVAGGALGLALGYPLVQNAMRPFVEENLGALFAFFRVTPAIVAVSFLLAAALGLVGALFPALSAAKLEIVSALRRVG